MRFSPSWQSLVALALLALTLSSCGGDDDQAVLERQVVEHYAVGVHASYQASLDKAEALDAAIGAFTAGPTDASLGSAKQAWIVARDEYGVTEAFRFYGGPIDDEGEGKEGLINAWPLDEAYVDYVDGQPMAGVINDRQRYERIDTATLIELNEKDGEANISTGWHAIEFLLWGQDRSETGPGDRPVSDYTTHPNAERRATYLRMTSGLLLTHLAELEAAWAPAADNYRADFVGGDRDESLRRIITGVGELSRGELAGERMNVAFAERSEEDEHSCFSDNTTADLVANAEGIRRVIEGDYGSGVSGPGVADLVAATDRDLAQRLRTEVGESRKLLAEIPAPFDQHLLPGVSDDSPGRRSIVRGMEALETQAETMVESAAALDVSISVS